MNAISIVIICVVLFLIYIELAIGFGYYMFLLTSKKTPNADNVQKRLIKRYSIIAGMAFPVTFAILLANKAAERR